MAVYGLVRVILNNNKLATRPHRLPRRNTGGNSQYRHNLAFHGHSPLLEVPSSSDPPFQWPTPSQRECQTPTLVNLNRSSPSAVASASDLGPGVHHALTHAGSNRPAAGLIPLDSAWAGRGGRPEIPNAVSCVRAAQWNELQLNGTHCKGGRGVAQNSEGGGWRERQGAAERK